jgi:hypothetical protein
MMSWYHDPAYEPSYTPPEEYAQTAWTAACVDSYTMSDMRDAEGSAAEMEPWPLAQYFHVARRAAVSAQTAADEARFTGDGERITKADELATYLSAEAETAESWLKTWEYREAPDGKKEWNRETTTAAPPDQDLDAEIAAAEADPNCDVHRIFYDVPADASPEARDVAAKAAIERCERELGKPKSGRWRRLVLAQPRTPVSADSSWGANTNFDDLFSGEDG